MSSDVGTHTTLRGPFVLGVDLSSHCIDFAKVDENTDTAIWSRCHLHGNNAWEYH